MFQFSSMRVSTRLNWLLALAALALALFSGLGLLNLRESLLEVHRSQTKNVVGVGMATAEYFHKQQLDGKLTEAQARQAAKDALTLVRFGNKDYFWITDMQGVFVMHPIKPEFVGTSKWDLKDANGKFIIREAVGSAKAGGGYLDYFWPKPGSDKAVQKMAYAQSFGPWDWMLTAGIYVDDVDAAFWREAKSNLFALVLVMAALVVVASLISRSVQKQLGGEPFAAAEMARDVAQGKLDQTVALRSGDSDSLMAQLNTMRESLATVVSQVRKGSEGVAAASAEIAQGNQDLSARTESQSSALQETAATMDQLDANVKHNAASAVQANDLARNASAVAAQGGAVVAKVVETMKGINEASGKIADIISVIDGIAFQTNILALNAAVEAARAGEQGRGFAVVAGEVRSLAGRAAEAAKEIKALINTSVKRVEEGSVLVDSAGHTMTEVVKAIQQVSSIVSEISAASAQQSQGVSQVGQAVAQMDAATQQNAALVEQMSAAASGLKSQAQELVALVAVFQLGRGADSDRAALEPTSFRYPGRALTAFGTPRLQAARA